MNIYLQIGIGLLPSIMVLFLLKTNNRTFILKVLTSVLFLILICFGIVILNNEKNELVYENTRIYDNKKIYDIENYPSKKQFMTLANKLYVNEDYDLVEEIIDDYSNLYEYDNECRILNARMYLAKTDYKAAKSLYMNLNKQGILGNENNNELEFAEKMTSNQFNNIQTINYLKSIESDLSEYGYNDTEDNTIKEQIFYDNDDILNSIKREIETDYNDDNNSNIKIEEILKRISSSNKEYIGLEDDINILNNIINKDNKILRINTVDRLFTKVNFLGKKYDDIVSNINDESSYHSLITAADLIMNKKMLTSISSNINDEISNDTIDIIKKNLKRIKNKSASRLNYQQQNALDDRIDSINKQFSESTLYMIKNNLAESNYNEKDESKINFTLAKINNYFNNDTLADDYLNTAIDSVYKSDDKYYKAAINNINIALNDNNSNYSANDISNYVVNANVNSLTIGEYLNIPLAMKETKESRFIKSITNNIIKAKNNIKIGEIDTSEFKTISANVVITNEQLMTANELENSIEIKDCGKVVDAKIEKINYDSVNIMLACDISGSMSGNIDFLKNSITNFIDNKNDNENLSIISFDSDILGETSFDSSKDTLYQFINGFKASGGTNIYETVKNCLEKFSSNSNGKNILIVMTDGKDGTSHKLNQINAEIGQLAQDKLVTIYTLGLGNDIDETYLYYIAQAGGGNYIPVQDGSSLSTFYDMLHMQADNIYKISYDAVNTTEKYDRTLEVLFLNSIYRDIKTYSLIDVNEIQDSYEFKDGKVVNGIYPQSIYKSDYETNVVLKGENFNKSDNISIKFSGPIEYIIDTYLKDDGNYNLTIPKNISVGNYDAIITINNTKKVLYNVFRVNEISKRKWIKFGAYNFTYEGNDFIGKSGGTMSGNVQLNGWLNFKGTLVFTGNYEEDYALEFSDSLGSYIEFDKTYSKGIAEYYADENIVVNIPPLNKFKLYNDEHNRYDYDKYQVDSIRVSKLELPNYVSFDGESLKLFLYPDKLSFSVNDDIQLLAFDKTFRKMIHDSFPINIEFSLEKAVISSTLIGIRIKSGFSMSGKISKLLPIKIFNKETLTSPSIKLILDSIKDEYEVEIACGLGILGTRNKKNELESPGVGLGLSFKRNTIEKIKLSTILSKPVIISKEPPIEANNFTFEVSNIVDIIEKGNWRKLKLKGQIDLSSCKASEYIPLLKKIPIINEMSLVSMPKTTLSLMLYPFSIEGNAKIMLLGLIEAESYELKIANYNYSSSILNIRNEDLFGILGSKKNGITINGICGYFENRLILEMSGEITAMANNRFIGFTNLGTTAIKVSPWVFDKDYKTYGEFAIGFYTTHAGKKMIVFASKDQNKDGKNKSSFYYIGEDWSIGKRQGQLT